MDGFFGGGFPGGFPGMGGGGGRQRPPRDPADSDTEQYYKDLGIAKGASSGEIKKAYRKLAVKHHPDKGGDPEVFKKITEAFEVLSNDEKRELYDQGGKEAVEQGHAGGGMDPFSAMFGGGGGRRQQGGEKKGKSVTHKLKVSLEQVYKGEVRKLRLGRVVINREKGVSKCSECDGRGMVVRMIRRGPMIQQMQSQCSSCDGGFRCERQNTKEILEVHVPRGAPNGHKLTFYEKGDEIPDGAAGDVHIVLEVADEATVAGQSFKRKGCDLYLKKKISLVEALCGFKMEVTHLDGRKLLVQTKAGEVTAPVKFDPFADEEDQNDWDTHDNTDCDLQPYAQAEITDADKLKQVIAKGQLKGKGITAFVIARGNTTFYQGSVEEVMQNTSTARGHTLHVLSDGTAGGEMRMMKCISEQGLPSPANPMLVGNLFLLLDIEFPTTISAQGQAALKAALPGPSTPVPVEADHEVHELVEKDPVASFKETNIETGHDDDDDDEGGGGGQSVQCQQQ